MILDLLTIMAVVVVAWVILIAFTSWWIGGGQCKIIGHKPYRNRGQYNQTEIDPGVWYVTDICQHCNQEIYQWFSQPHMEEHWDTKDDIPNDIRQYRAMLNQGKIRR